LDKVGFAVLTILALAGVGMPTASHAGDPLYIPHRRGEPSALSPDPSGTAATALPGERLSQDEADARIGWLVLTHIMDVRAALRRDHVEEAADKLARARAALRNLEKRLAGRSHGLALPSSLSASLAQSEAALSGGERAGADRALADAERDLQTALADLDAKLFPQSGAPR
jgi:hypothetical protein